jgi:hypothetical protein
MEAGLTAVQEPGILIRPSQVEEHSKIPGTVDDRNNL